MLPFARLLAALEDIRDPRRGQGKRYTLPHMLLFAILAVLAGATSYQSIITFISLHRERLNQIFGARFRRAPALNTLRNLILAARPSRTGGCLPSPRSWLARRGCWAGPAHGRLGWEDPA